MFLVVPAALRLGYATVLTLAVFGNAQALPGTGTVDSGDIKDGQVKRADLANRAVNSGKVALDGLTGNVIDEKTLGKVPNADKVDGLHARKFRKVMTGDVPPTTVSSLAGMVIEAGCSGEFLTTTLRARTTTDDAILHMGHVTGAEGFGSARFDSDADFDTTDVFDITSGFSSFGEATLTYSTPGRAVVSAIISWDRCTVQGTKIGG